jgi:hypothetical protein
MAAVGLPATRSHDAEWLFFSVGYYIIPSCVQERARSEHTKVVGAWKCGRAQGPMLHQLERNFV